MKTHEAITLKKHLSRLAEMDQKSPLDLSGAVRLKIAKTIRKCENVEADFEKVRIGLVRAKGTADADGNFNIERNTPAFNGFMAAIAQSRATSAGRSL